MTRCVRQHKVVKAGKLQKSESSLICVTIAEGSTNTLPVSTSIPAHLCISVSLYNKSVLLRTFTGFKYLGSVITDGDSKHEILARIAQTTAALTSLKPVLD